jgi:hypothetical protein
MQIYISENWKLSYTDTDTKKKATLDAIVPGSVELDLKAAGLIGDIMPCDDLSATEFLEGVDDWTYTTVFDAPDAPNYCKRELLIIEWSENGVTYKNHFVTGAMPWSYESWKLWSKKLTQ